MQSLTSFTQSTIRWLYPTLLISAIIILLVLAIKITNYKKSTYYQVTGVPYFSVLLDVGRYGEYLTYRYLRKFEKDGAKFLFNTYVPKENGETSEIDVLMLYKKGIFVFESKNYSGWIFGSEEQRNWYQTLPAGRNRSHKEHFYNPVMQNRSHIKHLTAFLGEQIPMHSVIVFSERCTLKKVQIHSGDIRVINRNHIMSVVSGICKQVPQDILTEHDITEIYAKLYPCTQVDEAVKTQHVETIHSKLATQSAPHTKEPPVPVNSSDSSDPTPMQTDEAAATPASEAEESPLPEPAVGDTVPQQNAKCPRCGGTLLLRTATRGENAGRQFYGCSNYPKCRYKQNIAGEHPSENP